MLNPKSRRTGVVSPLRCTCAKGAKSTIFAQVQPRRDAAARNAASHTRRHQCHQPAGQFSGAAAAMHLAHNDARKRKRPLGRHAMMHGCRWSVRSPNVTPTPRGCPPERGKNTSARKNASACCARHMAPTRQRLVACDCGQLLRGRYSARLVQCTHTITQQVQQVQQVQRGAQMSERERRACPLGLVCMRACPHAAARGVVT